MRIRVAALLLLIVTELTAFIVGVSVSLHADHGTITYADRWGIAAFMACIAVLASLVSLLAACDA